mmetsp:Transcript_25497/g.58834  ORF Transcript_25497/g.58834 Transcript_25497/m.58834 type:complete len:395 (+) Transcript_25497:90-1274(+)
MHETSIGVSTLTLACLCCCAECVNAAFSLSDATGGQRFGTISAVGSFKAASVSLDVRLQRLYRAGSGLGHMFWLFPVMIATALLGITYFLCEMRADTKAPPATSRTRLGTSSRADLQAPSSEPAPHPFGMIGRAGPRGPIKGFSDPDTDDEAGAAGLLSSSAVLQDRPPSQTSPPQRSPLGSGLSDRTLGAVGRTGGTGSRQNLSPALVVSSHAGWHVAIPTDLTPNHADTALVVQEVDSGKTLLRAYATESAAESGILLETAQYVPIAFLDTTKASRRAGLSKAGKQTGRQAALRLADSSGWDRQSSFCVFFLNTNIYGVTIVARRQGEGQELFSGKVTPDGQLTQMLDQKGNLQMELTDRSSGVAGAVVYKVAEGLDVGLVVAAVFAAKTLI